MGCLFSKQGQVRTLSDEVDEPLPASAFSTRGAAHAWLQEIGLPQYAEAFENAGFSDWDLLSCLTEADLADITAHTGASIPPGHRKKLLMASRQMGATSQATPATPLPFGSARRYSHGSNPGNNSRASGLTAAAAAAVSLERRSNGAGPRPSSTSRVPSLASVHAVQLPGLGHPHALLLGGAPRTGTEDGLVSGRRSRAVGVMVPSRNSSRSSLPTAPAGHAIGYIASPSVTGMQDGAGVTTDPWVPGDPRRSPGEPGSPTAAGAAGGAATADGGPTPPRQRRRWSANRSASRGVLVGGGGGGGMVVSTSSYRWLEPEAAVLGGGGAINDDVRQISMTSSVGDAYGIDPALSGVGGVGQHGGGGGGGPAVQPCLSRDLDALVMGASGNMNRAQPSRCQSLAATRPDRSLRGGFSNAGLPSSPPHRISGSNGGAAGAGGVGPAAHGLLGDAPYIRGSLRHSTAATATSQPPAQPTQLQPQVQPGAAHSHSQPNLDGNEGQQTAPRNQRVGSAREGGAALASVAAVNGSGAVWGTLGQAPSQRHTETAIDSTLKSWAPSPAAAGPPPPPPRPPAGVAAAAGTSQHPASAPGVAWALQGEVRASAPGGAVVANASTTSGTRPYDSDMAFPASTGGGRGAGTPGSALPRFVRAIAGWAIPTPAAAGSGGGVAADGGAAGSGGGGAAAGDRRARSGHRQRYGYQRRSEQDPGRASQPSDGATPVKSEGPGHSPAQPAATASATAALRPAAGDVLAAEPLTSAPARHSTTSAEPSRPARSQRQMMVPDGHTPRGPWDQDSALCIQGRGYKPQQAAAAAGATAAATPPVVIVRGPSIRSATGPGGPAIVDGDFDVTPSSVSRSRPVSGGIASAANSVTASPAARGGGWPFVMPQLSRHGETAAAASPPQLPPPGAAAALAAARAIGGGKRPSSGGNRGGGRLSSHGSPHAPAAGAAAVGPDGLLVPAMRGGSSNGAAAAEPGGVSGPVVVATSGLARVAAAEPVSSMLLESMASDGSTTATTRRAPLVHSSRPPDWFPSVGGASETTSTAHRSDVEESADELALYASGSTQQRPHRVQIVSPAMAAAAPYGGGLPPLRIHAGSSIGPVSQWPAMPLQPPTRAKPAAAPGPSGDGGVSSPTVAATGRMEVLASEAPGPSHGGAVPPGDMPRPTPGRKLDLEMLAGQVGRIMSHLANITKEEGEDDDTDMATAAAPAAGSPDGGDGGGGVKEAGGDLGPTDGAPPGRSPQRQGTARMQAIDQKRLELQHLHQDLVRRVAAMEADAPPAAAAAAAAAGAYYGSDDADAAEALAEVESRIRSKLTELAALTMRPDPDRCAAAAAHVPNGGCGSSGQARKRALGAEAYDDAGTRNDSGNGSGNGNGNGGGHRRAREEVALHLEVLAVLGARKRHVRGGASVAASAVASGGPSTPMSGEGSEDTVGRVLQQQALAGRPPAAATVAAPPPPPPLPGRPSAGPGAGGDAGAGDAAGGGGVVLAEMHDALRAELLAIDSKIKARVRAAPGAAVARRS